MTRIEKILRAGDIYTQRKARGICETLEGCNECPFGGDCCNNVLNPSGTFSDEEIKILVDWSLDNV